MGIEATGSMHWFLRLLEEVKIECLVGHPAKIRTSEPRKQKNDRRDARLLLKLLAENRFPSIWMPSREQRDLQILLRYRQRSFTCERNARRANSTVASAQPLAAARTVSGLPQANTCCTRRLADPEEKNGTSNVRARGRFWSMGYRC